LDQSKFDSINKLKILLVESNWNLRTTAKTYLGDLYTIDEANDGFSALFFLSQKNYNLVLIDTHLSSTLDGIETMNRIKKIPACKTLPILAISSDDNKEKLLNEGFSGCISKPFQKDLFISEVNRSLAPASFS
jgi:CheY-like chemotaxis protein